ncbi:MAG: type 4a pilus biogenesis protein PilO [Pseudomonadales bacterium]|jgi:type IV pilus assembly protein PilO|nr:type 4a pilus biogenesis protein PilO [Pseudomonadales bacterium]MDP6471799.1 type 4a pilus biogenesis protein PilO [Pseudomonadales bacterium]MDP6828787.1 type 4a pilus biogenesis protein PilO [Pseudomonadales bacterium]MDP6970280.1 type 4a pilus biogenesis protein PilO [Pseudomonadales bacterium]|tara:strand:- start:1088 stop:1705 length:618 start_codon:yes stop_codon:yes gene_type:complete
MALQDTLEQLQNFDLGDLDLNNIGSWPEPVKLIVMALLFVLVLGAGYYFYLTDKQSLLEQVQAKEQDLRRDYENKARQAVNLDAYRQQKTEMEATFGALLKQLPQDTEVPGLLEDITRTALDNELTIESVDLQPEQRTEFYVELPINITVSGGYHKIGSFVSGVANLSRIVTLHDFDIKPEKAKGAQGLQMNIVAKTYRYLGEDE